MKLTFEGRDWEFDLEGITLKQAVAMHLAYGFTVDDWLTELGSADPRALQCLYWLMLQQDGQVTAIQDADCKIVALAKAFSDASGDAGPEPQPDPTSPPSSQPGDQPSPVPAYPTVMTPMPPARLEEGGPLIAYTPAI